MYPANCLLFDQQGVSQAVDNNAKYAISNLFKYGVNYD